MFALVMYGERATAPATTRARPAKNKAENRLTREMVFVLRWKICAISLFALQGERTSRTRSSDAPPFQKARAWNNGKLYLPIKDMRMQTRIAPRNTRDRKSTRLNSSHLVISYAVFCLKKKKTQTATTS